MAGATTSRLGRIELSSEAPFELGGTTVDPRSHEILYDGRSQRLQPQPLKVLVALHDRIGDVVSRDELIQRCWDSRAVSEDVINRCVLVLRRLAAESGAFRIETVRKGGYRLMSTFEAAGAWRPWATAAFVTVLVGLGLVVWLWPPVQQGKPPLPRVALAPLDVAQRDVTSKKVASEVRASIEHMLTESGLAPRRVEAIRDLKRDADILISGKVQEDGVGAQVTVILQETLTGAIIFSKRFRADAPQLTSLPDRVGAEIATGLNWTGVRMVLDRRRPLPADIQSKLLNLLDAAEIEALRAYELSREIAPLAPHSAIAQLALAYNAGFALDALPSDQRLDALARGRRAMDRAQQLAPEFGEVYLPWCSLHSPIRIVECDAEMRRASRVDPEASNPAFFRSALLETVGRDREALQLAQVALAADPYEPSKLARVVRLLEATGKRVAAERLYAQALRWWPDHPALPWSRAVGILERGDWARLNEVRNRDPSGMPFDHEQISILSKAVLRKDRSAVERVCEHAASGRGSQPMCMIAFADVGNTAAALAIANAIYVDLRASSLAGEDQKFVEHPGGASLSFLTAPAARELRRDPAFAALADRVGLMRYWRAVRIPDFCDAERERECPLLLNRGK